MSHSKQKGASIAVQSGTFALLQDSLTRSPGAKRTQIRPWYVSLIEVKHEIKPISMIKHLNMPFTSFAPNFLWAKIFQNQKSKSKNFV